VSVPSTTVFCPRGPDGENILGDLRGSDVGDGDGTVSVVVVVSVVSSIFNEYADTDGGGEEVVIGEVFIWLRVIRFLLIKLLGGGGRK